MYAYLRSTPAAVLMHAFIVCSPLSVGRLNRDIGPGSRGLFEKRGTHMTEMANAAHNAPTEEAVRAALAEHLGKDDDPAKYGVEGCCYRTFWAVVERDGSLVRGRNVARTARLGSGQYEIVFTSDVRNGVYVASIGRPGIATEPAGEIGVALRCCLPGHEADRGVWVDTHDSVGVPADRSFHLVVHTQ
jgi:hypothetical protein